MKRSIHCAIGRRLKPLSRNTSKVTGEQLSKTAVSRDFRISFDHRSSELMTSEQMARPAGRTQWPNRLAHGSTGKGSNPTLCEKSNGQDHPGIVGCAMGLPEAGGRGVESRRQDLRGTGAINNWMSCSGKKSTTLK